MTQPGSLLLQQAIDYLEDNNLLIPGATMEQAIQQAISYLQEQSTQAGQDRYGKNDPINGDTPDRFADQQSGLFYPILQGRAAYGQMGNDQMHLGGGLAFGGEGSDIIRVRPQGGIGLGGNGDDTFYFNTALSGEGSTMFGGHGKDTFGTLTAGAVNAVVYGGYEDDTIYLKNNSVAKYNSINEMSSDQNGSYPTPGDVVTINGMDNVVDFSEMSNTSPPFGRLMWSTKTDPNTNVPNEFAGQDKQAILVKKADDTYLLQVDSNGDGKVDRQITIIFNSDIAKKIKFGQATPMQFIKF